MREVQTSAEVCARRYALRLSTIDKLSADVGSGGRLCCTTRHGERFPRIPLLYRRQLSSADALPASQLCVDPELPLTGMA